MFRGPLSEPKDDSHIIGKGIAWRKGCVKHTQPLHTMAYFQMAKLVPPLMADRPKTKRIHLRLNSDLYDLLVERAKDENRSVTNMIATYLTSCVGLPSSVVVERLNNKSRSRTRRKSK